MAGSMGECLSDAVSTTKEVVAISEVKCHCCARLKLE
jgi:hypothetical protein